MISKWLSQFIPYNIDIFCINHGDQNFFFLFEIFVSVLALFVFFWIPMLWVYGDYNF